MTRRLFPVLLVACVAGCNYGSGSASPDGGAPVVTFVGGNPTTSQISVQIADSPEERAQGLMGVTEMSKQMGMAFVWDQPTTSDFWMKDTLIPLSVAFVDDGGTIVTITDMEPCTTDPCPTYGAAAPYVLAIETNVGYFDRQEIQVGDRAELGTGPAS